MKKQYLFLFLCSMFLMLILSSTQNTTAIYQGTTANGEFPWMVNIVAEDGGLNFIDDRFCGGVLIDSEWVLTAHHCWRTSDGEGAYYSNDPGTQFFAVIGGQNYDSSLGEKIYLSGSPIPFSSIADYSWPDVDLALWKLSSPSSKLPVQIGSMSTIESLISSQGSFTTMGYGKNNFIDFNSDDLMKISFSNMDTTQYSNMLFADINAGDPSVCGRDSGGPLIYYVGSQRFLAGLVHAGDTPNCGSVQRMFFEQVPDYKSWIYQTIDPSSYSSCIDNSATNHSGDLLRLFDQTHCNGNVWSTNQTGQLMSIGNFSPYSMDIQPGYSVSVYNSQSAMSACYSGDLWDMNKDYYPGSHDSIANNIAIVKLISGSCSSSTPDAPPSPDTQPLPSGPQEGSGGGVKLYQHPNFEGDLLYTFNPGFSNEPNAEGYSLEIPDGWSVITYRGDNHTGINKCWSSSVPNLQDYSDWQTKIQSLQIYSINMCETEPPTATTGVRMYRNTNYGSFFQEFNVNFHQHMLWDEGIESIKVPNGWSVVVHQMSDRDWKSECFNTNVPDIAETGDWDNKVYGIDVYDDDVCSDDLSSGVDFILYLHMGLVGDNYSGSVPSGGVFTIADLTQFYHGPFSGDWNDRISSFRVRDGYSMHVWDDPNFTGPGRCIRPGGRTNFRGYDDTLSNGDRIAVYPPVNGDRDSRITSLAIYDNPNCDGSPDMPESAWGYSVDNGNLALGQFVMSAEENNNQSVLVEWIPTDMDADGYHVYEHIDDDQYELVATLNSRYAASYTFNNLPCGTDYHYTIKSFNSWGDSATPNLVSVSTPSCFVPSTWSGEIYLPLLLNNYTAPVPPTEGPKPNTPTGFQVVSVGESTVTVSWIDNSSIEEFYQVRYQITGTPNVNDWTVLEFSENSNSAIISDLDCGESYTMQVRAKNVEGGSVYYSWYSDETVHVTTTGCSQSEGPYPNAPTGLTVDNITASTFEVSWVDNSNIEDEYQLHYYRVSNGEVWQHLSLSADAESAVINNTVCGNRYNMFVRVKTADGHSTDSEWVYSVYTPDC